MSYKNIAKLIPTIQSINLVNENLKTMKKPKKDSSGKGIRANKGRSGCKDTELIGLGMKNIIGIELIKAQAGLV